MSSNKKKNDQLGMPYGTACNRLRKNVLFNLLVKHKENMCFQCGEPIESSKDLSMDHKIPWIDDSPDLFWDLDNIAFSHLSCNVGAARPRAASPHGAKRRYEKGCRCELCTEANTNERRRYRSKKKSLLLQK